MPHPATLISRAHNQRSMLIKLKYLGRHDEQNFRTRVFLASIIRRHRNKLALFPALTQMYGSSTICRHNPQTYAKELLYVMLYIVVRTLSYRNANYDTSK